MSSSQAEQSEQAAQYIISNIIVSYHFRQQCLFSIIFHLYNKSIICHTVLWQDASHTYFYTNVKLLDRQQDMPSGNNLISIMRTIPGLRLHFT